MKSRPTPLAMLVLVVCLCLPVFGCGAPAAPEIDSDVAAEIQAEDQAVLDAESEL